ncbi:hypothetical protein T01_2653 [Trichinella spiralis]|uniref:Uncharacterized protein n=1 Tax=Trichinella spiralis TaxID=6334 RepID=A0A0V1BRY9_TRISP|nr:hypothetical protein T01_2653 [Trichinella spiralis]
MPHIKIVFKNKSIRLTQTQVRVEVFLMLLCSFSYQMLITLAVSKADCILKADNSSYTLKVTDHRDLQIVVIIYLHDYQGIGKLIAFDTPIFLSIISGYVNKIYRMHYWQFDWNLTGYSVLL